MSTPVDNRTSKALHFQCRQKKAHLIYIPPGFTVITCEPVNETMFQSWAVLHGGVWHPESEGWNHSRQAAHADWDFGIPKYGSQT